MCRAADLSVELVAEPVAPRSTADDTRRAAEAARQRGVDLILFAGGDGTARDITGVVGTEVPVLGIPAGVKMHSGVFGSTPEVSGATAAAFLATGDPRTVIADVVDVDEAALREDRRAVRLYGAARVPVAPGRVLAAKAGGGGAGGHDETALAGACAALAGRLEPAALHLIGPGTTMRRITAELGLDGSLLGVDAIRDGRLVGRDLDEGGLLQLLDGEPAEQPARLVLGVVGGQGMLLGRGNQQLSAAVLRRIDRGRITVVAGKQKLLALAPTTLRVDTGDPVLDAELSGHLAVRVGARETLMMPVTA
jgi:predicted polyphosphate/ATP-dependent NAD kinase